MEDLHMTIRTPVSWARRIRVFTLPLVFVLVVVWLLVGLKAQGPAPEYTVTDLGAWNPTAINRAGDIVGFSSGGPLHSLLWSQGVLTDLGTMGGSDALALGINDARQISGVLNGSSGFEHFIFTNGAVTRLGTHPATYYATRINNTGDVAGQIAGPQAFWYSHIDGVHYLTAPGCGGSYGVDINDSGLVLGGGVACGSSSALGFVWRNGSPQMLPQPPGYADGVAEPYGVNAGGQIVGAVAVNNGNAQPTLWRPDGAGGYTATILPLPLGVTNGIGAFAKDINDLGTIVGWAHDPFRAVIWDSPTSVRDLNSLIPSDSGVVLEGTEAINNDGLILAYGGGHGYLLTPVSPPAQTFTPTGSMNLARTNHQATLLQDGRVLVTGGTGYTASLSEAEIFDPTTGTWALTGSTVTPRQEHAATRLSNGRVLLVGGVSDYYSCSSDESAETYDPATGVWTATASLPITVGTGTIAVTLNDGRVLVAGGGNRCGSVFETAALYDPTTDTWSQTGSMSIPREFHSAVLLADGRVLVAGGASSAPFVFQTSAEIFDPTTGSWSAAGAMGTGRGTGGGGYVQTFLARTISGSVVAAGGISGRAGAGVVNAAADVFDPAASAWSPAESMSTPRYATTLTTLSSGQVLIAGGVGGAPSFDKLATAEIFDPLTGMWTATGSLTSPRSSHTATRLLDGRVLIAGGQDTDGDLATAELYGPTSPGDSAPPSVSCASPDEFWHATNVAIACTANDAASGLANPADASFALTTNVPAGSEDANAATDSRTVCDNAGNCTVVGPVPGNKIDLQAPTIAIAAPAGGTFALGQLVASSYSCTDGGSGAATCTGPVANGEPIDTTTVGSHTFTVTATDSAGNTATSSVTYTVTPVSPPGQTFSDGFEGATLNSFWTIYNGSADPAATYARTGDQSMQVQWNSNVQHAFGSQHTGTLSVWVLGSQLSGGAAAAIEVLPYLGDVIPGEPYRWVALVVGGGQGSFRQSSGGPYTVTNFPADLTQWHHLEVQVDASGATARFDGAIVGSEPSVTSFGAINLTVWGGGGSGPAYYDDFSVSASVLAQGPSPENFVTIDHPEGFNGTYANGINDAGAVVGRWSDDADHGFILTNGVFTTIDVPGSVQSEARAVNSTGSIVGYYTDADGATHGYLLEAGTFSTIDAPSAVYTLALGVNDVGEIVGTYQDAAGVHGFKLSGGVLSSLDVPDASRTSAYGINSDGDVVGWFSGPNTNFAAKGFVWRNGGFTVVDFPGASSTFASGINDHGEIVGQAAYYSSPNRAFVLRDGVYSAIDVPPGTFDSAAWSINDSGRIVGQYSNAGLDHGFLLIPSNDDSSPPTVSCASPDELWHASNVSLACTAADSGSGLVNPADASFALTTGAPAGSEDANAATDSRTVCDNAGNCTVVGPIAGNKIDLRAPTIVITVPTGSTFALGQSVVSNYSCTDGGSGVATCAGPVASGESIDTTTAGSHTFTITATDTAGNATTSSATYTVEAPAVDTTPPTISCASPDGLWHASNVSLVCTASDAGSGLANPADASFTLSTNERPIYTVTTNATTGSYTVCDNAGNCVTAGPITGIKIDMQGPAVFIAAPTAITFLVDQRVPSSYSCLDRGSDMATCAGPVASGEFIDTSTVGLHAFTVTATDNAGNTTAYNVTYMVATVLPPSRTANHYTVTDLGAFDPSGINSRGDVVGSTRVGEEGHVVMWSQGVLSDLGTMGGSSADARGINDLGQIVGTVVTSNGTYPYIYANGSLVIIDSPGGTVAGPNNLGQVAGSRNDGTPYLYSNGTFQYLNMAGCAQGYPSDLNDSGWVIGTAVGGDCGEGAAVVWRNGNLHILPAPAVLGTTGRLSVGKINAAGQIAGSADSLYVWALNETHIGMTNGRRLPQPVFWEPDGAGNYTVVSVGMPRGGMYGTAHGVNDVGVAVGEAWSDGGYEFGFVWDSTTGIRRLNFLIPPGSDSGGHLSAAIRVNNTGLILARGNLGISPRPGDVYLLTPMPPGNTPSGTNIAVQPTDSRTGTTPVNLTFSSVQLEGNTTLAISDTGPAAPAGFQAGNPAVYYDVQTTATFLGQIQVCINYSGTSFDNDVALFHYENEAWVDVTLSVDTAGTTVCGAVTSLSPFAVFQSVPPADTTPPSLTVPASVAVEATGPGGAVVAFSVTASDPDDEAGPVTCSPASGSTFPIGTTVVACTSSDTHGNVATESFTVTVRDTTPPTISCAAPSGSWHKANVSLACTASDAGSGLTNAADASFTLGTNVPQGAWDASASTGSHTVCDNAHNCATAGPIAGNQIDLQPPTITIAIPTASTFMLGQQVASSYSCADGGSGVATCSGSVANGGTIDTTTIGVHSFVVTATDLAGNTTTSTATYVVAYAQCVLFDETKAHKAGSTVPIKLQLCNAVGTNASDASVPIVATAVYQVSSSAPGVLADSGEANPDNQFRFAGDGYIFNLSLKGFATGTYALVYKAGNDPTNHTVQFQVK
jgi:probable HAF family extracellular repeat protein